MKKRILLVDDVEFNLEFQESTIRSIIEEMKIDIDIDTASTVMEAMAKIEGNDPYDAMIVDMNLPDGTGSEIAKMAIEKSSETRIAALTIYPSKYEDQRGYFDLYLRKPIMPNAYKESFIRLLKLY